MKKWIFAAIAATMFLGNSSVAFAQKHFTKPAITPELTTEADAALQSSKAGPDAMKDALKLLLKKKTIDDMASIGYYYFDKGEIPMATEMAKKMYDKDAKFVPGLLLSGDIYMSQKKWGEAGQKFDKALNYDPEMIEAYLKKAEVYKNADPQTAIGALMELKNIDSSNVDVDRELGSIYYKMNNIPEAINSYKAYMDVEKSPTIDALREYAIALFVDTDYVKSLEVVKSALPKDPKDISLNRMKFYDEIETKDFNTAFTDKDKLFGQYNDTMYNYKDYKYLGRLEKEMKMYPDAVKDLEKALSLKKNDPQLYKDLSDLYLELPDYDKSIANYKIYADSAGTELSSIDLLDFGKIYYQAASDEITPADKKTSYITQGDALFQKLSEKSADTYYGPFWRARINSLKDPTNPLEDVKGFYEEALKRIEGKDNKMVAKEANRYLAFYYLKKDDNVKSKDYCSKVLQIDPEDKLAKQIMAIVSK